MTEISISGVYCSTIYRDKKTGKSAFTIQSQQIIEHRNAYGSINCFGYIPIINKGLPITITGYWAQNKSHKYYFHVLNLKKETDNPNEIIAYLKNSAFLGIGEILASNIIAYTGCDIFRFIEKHKDAENLIATQVKGITQERVHNMIVQLKSNTIQQQIYDYIKSIGGDFEHVDKLYEIFKENAIHELKRNPFIGYKANMNFYLCDALAKQENKPILYQPRLKAIMYTALEHFFSNGHTYTTLECWLKEIKKIEKKSVYQEEIPSLKFCSILRKLKNITLFSVNEKICITTTEMYQYEKNIIRHIHRLQNSKKQYPFQQEHITQIEKNNNIIYGESQKKAFHCLKASGVNIITGGPGTGKTTVIKGIIKYIMKMFPEEEILLLAPTGRAAQRMKETTGFTSYTIHKGLDYKPFDDEISSRNENNPLSAKFILVDEMSMVGTKLMSMLLDAIQNGSLLLLFGDTQQLPSVDAGNILHDLLLFDIIPHFYLTDVYRQQKDSTILYNELLFSKTKKINFKEGDDFHIIRVSNTTELNNKIKEIIQTYYSSDNPYYTQVLTPIKKQKTGVLQLNKELQEVLNREDNNILYGNVHFRLNDKVIFTKNNYKDNYFNGDIGTIVGFQEGVIDVLVNNEVISVSYKNLKDLMLAYAITIHKSQGSEFPVCIIALPKTVLSMLDRNLLFTAITRARQEVYIISEEDALELAIENEYMKNRLSTLAYLEKQQINLLFST